jgi:hypothetical protein
MKKYLIFLLVLGLAACNQNKTKNDSLQNEKEMKTISYYKQNHDVLKNDLAKCESIPISDHPDWCTIAQQANRTIAADRIRDSVKHRAY